jgi:hypothetical protein
MCVLILYIYIFEPHKVLFYAVHINSDLFTHLPLFALYFLLHLQTAHSFLCCLKITPSISFRADLLKTNSVLICLKMPLFQPHFRRIFCNLKYTALVLRNFRLIRIVLLEFRTEFLVF